LFVRRALWVQIVIKFKALEVNLAAAPTCKDSIPWRRLFFAVEVTIERKITEPLRSLCIQCDRRIFNSGYEEMISRRQKGKLFRRCLLAKVDENFMQVDPIGGGQAMQRAAF